MFVKTFTRRISFTGDPLAVFLGFSLQNREAALFESPIGAGRRAERSFLFIRHALRLTANDRTVRIVSISDEGRAVLNGLSAELLDTATVTEDTGGLTVVFPPRLEDGSDRFRIKAPSAADALLHLDGEEEFIIYLAPVGKTR